MHELLMQLLVSGPDHLWQAVWRSCFRNIVAQHAFGQLDGEGGGVRERWRALDETRERRRLFGGKLLWDSLTACVVARAPIGIGPRRLTVSSLP
jgi:hypothetical protein